LAKITWVNVDGEFKEVINVWQNINGEWKDRVIPKGAISGLGWKEFMQYRKWIYKEGVEYIDLNKHPLSSGYVDLVKDDDCMIVRAESPGVGSLSHIEIASERKVKLNDYTELNFDMRKNKSGGMTIGVGIKDFGSDSFDTYRGLGSNTTTSRSIFKVDVTDLKGDYYIKIDALSTTNTEIYNIWLE